MSRQHPAPSLPPHTLPCWLTPPTQPWPQVLDLIEVLVTKQPESPLVLELLEPLLSIIRRSMRSSSTAQQEQDLLHKTARIFM